VAFAYTDAFGEAGFADAAGFFKAADLPVQLVALPNSGAIVAAASANASKSRRTFFIGSSPLTGL